MATRDSLSIGSGDQVLGRTWRHSSLSWHAVVPQVSEPSCRENRAPKTRRYHSKICSFILFFWVTRASRCADCCRCQSTSMNRLAGDSSSFVPMPFDTNYISAVLCDASDLSASLENKHTRGVCGLMVSTAPLGRYDLLFPFFFGKLGLTR